MLKTTIVGSLPKPTWLSDPKTLRASWRLEGDDLTRAQDDAVRLALLDQEEAGLDVVCDGEIRRRHYIWGFLEGLTGIDTEHLGTKRARGGRYTESTAVARITGEVTRPRPVFLDALRYARSHTDRLLKVTLPGPMTTVDSLFDEHYGADEKSLALRFAELVNAEARELSAAGADVIQFDEPCFNIYLDKVKDWGIEALERAMAGVTATKAVHICYGYGTPAVLQWKNANQDWGHYGVSLPLLAQSSVDQVSVECAASGVDVALLGALKGKDVLIGVIDVGTEDVETPETVRDRLRAALPYVDPERLYGCTDCGMVPLSRDAALGKMRALAAGAALLRRELGG
ncbi:MAG TPA: methionine synthase [Dehalococcoidia bacterium]|nr:methionine synthase [Dehalococcoidia bacterium]